MPFNQTVDKTDNPAGIKDSDVKIDTTPKTEEEKEKQEETTEKMLDAQFDDVTDDIKDDDISAVDSEEKEEEEEESKPEEETPKEDESEAEEETPEEETPKPADEETPKEASKKEAITESKEDLSKLSVIEREDKVICSLYEENKDILPESFITNWKKFLETGNKTFLELDNHLYRFTVTVRKFNDGIPVEERLKDAFEAAFARDIARREKETGRKQGMVETEVRTQKVGKAASDATKSSLSESKTGMSDEQKDIMKRMEIPLDSEHIPKEYK